ncbi:CASP-like protein 1f1 [Phtheirospermum japonicum]|uniref:CASP-like protein n=1 Tax=Phtheirospermum japonicum TaxID=374723 RepID=A0A830D086_9LAMI|nr:CASP-like protein 1f1 [Phtheirospermum japonicum]
MATQFETDMEDSKGFVEENEESVENEDEKDQAKMIALLLMAACAASMTTAFTGKYGNSHVGWMAICDHFAKFCNRGQAVIILTYLGFALYLILTLVSPRNCYISKPLDLIKKGDL